MAHLHPSSPANRRRWREPMHGRLLAWLSVERPLRGPHLLSLAEGRPVSRMVTGPAGGSLEDQALSTTSEPAKLEEGEEPLVLRIHPQARGRTYRRTRRPAASRGGCPSTADGKEKARSYALLATPIYSALGGLRQDPGRAAQSPAEAGTCGDQEFAKYVCRCRRVGLAGRRTAGGTRGAGVGAAGLRGAAGRNATF